MGHIYFLSTVASRSGHGATVFKNQREADQNHHCELSQ